MKSPSLTIQRIWTMLKFLKIKLKVGQTSKSRSGGKKLWYQLKCLVQRNTHMKYESPITYHSKDMCPLLKILKRMSNFKIWG
jgi:hypothetical protein